MKKLLLSFVGLLSMGMVMAQTDLFISEYVEGSGNNKAIEIYNPTPNAIDLSSYYIARFSNGSNSYTAGGLTHLSGTIQPFSTYILVNGQTTSTATSPACSPILQGMLVPNGGPYNGMMDGTYPAPTYMNGNDAIALMKDLNSDGTPETPVDLFGKIGLLGIIEAETGWSNIQDTVVNYHVRVINGTDTTYVPVSSTIASYIVKAKDDSGQYYGPFWMCWTANHTLVRKFSVITGIKVNPALFAVSQQWDTLPGGEDIWTELGRHNCVVHPISVPSISQVDFSVYPNPSNGEKITLSCAEKIKEVRVVNMIGQTIYHNTKVNVMVSSFVLPETQPGVYFVKISLPNGKQGVKKMIIR